MREGIIIKRFENHPINYTSECCFMIGTNLNSCNECCLMIVTILEVIVGM